MNREGKQRPSGQLEPENGRLKSEEVLHCFGLQRFVFHQGSPYAENRYKRFSSSECAQDHCLYLPLRESSPLVGSR